MSIKFTPFGIPYIPEFEHVSFAPPSPSSSSSSSSFCYVERPPTPPSRLSFFRRKPVLEQTTKPLPPPPKPDIAEPHGIFIQFSFESAHSQMSRKQRLVHLQQTISVAVLDAGMRCSPGNTAQTKTQSNDISHRTPGNGSADALFCGTYGQMMAALEGAGLSATPCVGKSLSGHTRLGALFVARNDGASHVQLKKITLWG